MSTVRSMRRVREPARHTRARPAAGASPPGPLLRATWTVLGWSILIGLLILGFQRLEALALAPRVGLECRLEWAQLPHWLTAPTGQPVLAAISEHAGLAAECDILDPELCARIGAGLRTCPWVAEVQRVAKRGDGRIEVTAVFREPFTFVEQDGEAYLVDRAGTRLPATYKIDEVAPEWWTGAPPDRPGWFRITGVQAGPPPEGAVWPGTDLVAGLKLVTCLTDAMARGLLPYRALIRAIDVRGMYWRENDLEAPLQIRFIAGAEEYTIHWGLPPGEEYRVDATAMQKLEVLRREFSRCGQTLPPTDLDVRDEKGLRRGRWWEFRTGRSGVGDTHARQ